MKHCDSDYYADDATVHTHGSAPNVIESKLQQDGNNTKLWCKQNKMEINHDKTTCMIVRTQHRTKKNILPLNICIDGNKINDVKKQKLLGIYIDENLHWTEYIDHLCANISSKISLLRQLSTYIPTEAQKMFYQGYILPLIDYGSCTWGTTSKSNLERLSRLQKRAARIILNVPYDTATSDMFNA